MKIYVISASESDYDDWEILEIFDDKQKAEALAKQYKTYCDKSSCFTVEEYTLNNLTQETTERILNSLDKLKNELLGDK